MESKEIITIYRGEDPRELAKIEQTMNMKGVSYDKSLYLGFVGPLTCSKLFALLKPWWLHNPYFQNRAYLASEIFEIKVRRKDEFAGKKIIEDLKLSQPVLPSNPSVFSKILLIIGSISFLLFLAFLVHNSTNAK